MNKRSFAATVALVIVLGLVPSGRASDSVETLAALVKGLTARDDSVRLNAALALGKLGRPAVSPVAALLTAKAEMPCRRLHPASEGQTPRGKKGWPGQASGFRTKSG